MILDNLTELILASSNYKYYQGLGYEGKIGQKILVRNKDLQDGTSVKEDRQCDCCGKIYTRRHSQHVRSFKRWNEDLCMECSHDEAHTKKTTERRRQTCLEKYGADNPSRVSEFQNNRTNTMLERYGVVNYFQADEFQEKAIATSLERYGTEFPCQSEEVKEKSKQTCLERYGVENPTANSEIRAKQINACLEKYGAVSSLGNSEIREKGKKTMLERYGYEQAGNCPELLQKAAETRLRNGNGVSTSTQQLQVKAMLDKIAPHYEHELNYVLSFLFLDIALFITEDLKIDIEYDGSYWHKDSQKDRRRDEFVKSQGFKVLRIRSGHLIPTQKELIEAINKLLSGYNFTQIILKDWKIEENKSDLN